METEVAKELSAAQHQELDECFERAHKALAVIESSGTLPSNTSCAKLDGT